MVEFRLLGGLEVRAGGRAVALGHARQSCVLAALLLDANRPVPADQLLHRVWDGAGPRRARETLYSYLSRLRRELEPHGICLTRRSGGYVIEVDETTVDLFRFRHLVARAREAPDDPSSLDLFDQALALWRGEPLAGLDSSWMETVREQVRAERWAAELDRTDVMLNTGHHTRALAGLTAAAAAHQLDERLAGQLMLALFRDGRPADALAHYRCHQERLAEELGVDPGPALRQLHERIRTSDAVLAAPVRAVSPSEPSSPAVPRQLPSSPPVFTGRRRQLQRLTAALDVHADGRSAPVLISAAGGAGKSWLAVRWAHENLRLFPDGQLYVNLMGFAPSAEPMPAALAVHGFLNALGVAPGNIPGDPQAQSALYRSLLADRRMLIVLDDARDADQIRPLLPGSPSCTVLVTSRNRLAGLVTTHGATPLALDLFDETEARELLTRHLGERKVAAEAEAVAPLLEYCAGLPLALGIVAARAAAQPSLPLAALAQELAEAATRIDSLDAGDLTVSLRAVLSASHDALTPPARRLYALLGLAPGPDTGLAAAASLAALPPARARSLLTELESAHLVQQLRPGRYQMHDLVRLFAAELSSQEQDTAAALSRLVDHYLHTAHRAGGIIAPHRPSAELAPPVAGCAPAPLAGQDAALEWFSAEHAHVLGVQPLAARQGAYTKVRHLAYALDTFHWRQSKWQENLTAWRNVLSALPDQEETRDDRALAHQRVGQALGRLHDKAEAVHHLDRALAIAQETGDLLTQAHTHMALGSTWSEQIDHGRALGHFEHAIQIYRTLDSTMWEVGALTGVTWCLARLGRHQEAIRRGELAALHSRRHGWSHALADILHNLGYATHGTGDHARALDYYEQAIELSRELGDTRVRAAVLSSMGDTHHALGHLEEARRTWTQARGFYLGQHRAALAQEVQRKLDALGQAPGG